MEPASQFVEDVAPVEVGPPTPGPWPLWASILLFLLFFAFSSWLMYQTFDHDRELGLLKVARTVYSDFASHIPLIRSFSLGANWPPEFPLYPGSPIRYHFLFYAVVGGLEGLGVRLDAALNVLSAIGFAFLLMMIFQLARLLFSLPVAVLSVLFFLFNGSLAFVEFFEMFPLSVNTLSEIWQLRDFPTFGPWDGSEISAFWNLNIYTNQRHLAWAYGLVLLFVYAAFKIEPGWDRRTLLKGLGLGVLFGLLPLLHQPSTLIFAVFGVTYFLLLHGKRRFLFTVGATALAMFAIEYPFFLTHLGQGAASGIHWQPGYLIAGSLTFTHFFSYWFQNIGLHLLFVPLGLILASNRVRIALLPALILFALALMFQFAVELAANHKLINFAILMLQMASAFALVSLWRFLAKRVFVLFRWVGYTVVAGCVFFMLFSGAIDLMVIKNDYFIYIPGSEYVETVAWIEQHTPGDAVFVNSSYLYHPASLAGRRIFLGWPYFAWSAGYNVDERQAVLNDIYDGADFETMCTLMEAHELDYVTIQDHRGDPNFPRIDYDEFVSQKTPDYVHPHLPYAIYARQTVCA